jgi:hypothetical protein
MELWTSVVSAKVSSCCQYSSAKFRFVAAKLCLPRAFVPQVRVWVSNTASLNWMAIDCMR